ncbi:MAG: hypothetical protein ABI868_15350 [Acidobacteriota bacterium]
MTVVSTRARSTTTFTPASGSALNRQCHEHMTNHPALAYKDFLAVISAQLAITPL